MRKYRVAVINDDRAYIEMMASILEEEGGYESVSGLAEKGAYQLIEREKPDLVMIDLKMEHPDSGLNVLQMLRLNRETAELPVILCSADTRFLDEKQQDLRAQHCDILHKPFELDVLLETITRNLPAR